MMKRRKTNTGICILLLLSIFIIEGCSLERTVNGSFCKRQYTPGVFIDNPAKKKDVSSNSITTCKKNEPAMTQAVAIRNQVVAGKKTQLVAELKRMAINTAKENIAGKHNTFFVPVLSKKNVTINGIKNSLNTNENPVLAPNSKPWKWYRIVGVTLALLGFIVFFTVGFIGPAV
ncbi:MAG TPA: hypothetical protein VK783_14000, partial [Bacteroidia bacterium]|nr:hypothetical protein [Bacteroidia bacterium]